MDTAIKLGNNKKKQDQVFTATKPFPVLAFVVGGDYDSALGFRARAMAAGLTADYKVRIAYRSRRKILSSLKIFAFVVRARPVAIYVFDISYTGIFAAGLHKLLFRKRLIIETGDAIVELVRSTGSRGRLGIWLTRLLENVAFRIADRVVVRGSYHKEWLGRQGIESEVIQDGVDTASFIPKDTAALRRRYRLEDVTTVGLVGSSTWSEKLQMCYGWELVETLRLLKDRPVKGIMIGGGSGIPHLKARCREYGLEERVVFLGQVPFAQLPDYLGLIDICLSTQTNNLVGQVRTTGKLPVYLAAGRYVLASSVGEAKLVLEKDMLIEYEGVKDHDYPRKLQKRIETLLNHPEMLARSANNVALAKEHFDYAILAERMRRVIEATISGAN